MRLHQKREGRIGVGVARILHRVGSLPYGVRWPDGREEGTLTLRAAIRMVEGDRDFRGWVGDVEQIFSGYEI